MHVGWTPAPPHGPHTDNEVEKKRNRPTASHPREKGAQEAENNFAAPTLVEFSARSFDLTQFFSNGWRRF